VNHKTLKHIAQSSELLDAGAVQDLIELTKRFPYFAWPFALLARHYHQKQDFRTEALMHQAAMRIHDRTWLFGFTHDAKSLESTDSKSLTSTELAIENTGSAIENTGSAIENIGSAIENSTLLESNPPLIVNPTPALEAPLQIEISKEEEKSFAKIATKTEPKPEPKKSKPQFRPETAAYDLERIFSFTEPEKPQEHQGNASNDFYSWLNGKQKKSQPEKTNPLQPVEEVPQNVEHQKSIIENFLLTKPSISRPKQEFFKPEKAQKKGEKLTGAIVTETLARIYLKQDNPQKAIWAYEQLQLKFPEKKTYFANLISQIEKEQNKS
jgi:hypothetical protein